MDFTLSVPETFPDETKVGVYKLGGVVNTTEKPIGKAVTTAKVESGKATFKELNANQSYWAGAEVSKEWRYVRFSAGTPGAGTELAAGDNATITGKWTFSASPLATEELEVNGAFNQDGETFGALGATPVKRQAKLTATKTASAEYKKEEIENALARITELEKALIKLGFLTE